MTFPLKLQFLPSELCGDNQEFEKSVLASDPEGGGEKLNRLYFFLKGKIEELEDFKPTRRTRRPSTDYDEAAAAIIAENDWENLLGDMFYRPSARFVNPKFRQCCSEEAGPLSRPVRLHAKARSCIILSPGLPEEVADANKDSDAINESISL